MYQRMYTCKHVPLRVLPRVLARVSLGVPMHAQAHVHLSVFFPYENFMWLYTHLQRWGDLIAIANHFESDHNHEVNVAHIFEKKSIMIVSDHLFGE